MRFLSKTRITSLVPFFTHGHGSKRKLLGTTGFGLFFLLPIGFFGYPFLTHSHIFPPPNMVCTWSHVAQNFERRKLGVSLGKFCCWFWGTSDPLRNLLRIIIRFGLASLVVHVQSSGN